MHYQKQADFVFLQIFSRNDSQLLFCSPLQNLGQLHSFVFLSVCQGFHWPNAYLQVQINNLPATYLSSNSVLVTLTISVL